MEDVWKKQAISERKVATHARIVEPLCHYYNSYKMDFGERFISYILNKSYATTDY